ncbi:MAG: SGNH/GDSL hydrolase family protein [Clostridia bacterium]|nr:SGNH/GDSL hydrolase family protein [Clostridia bacterium]
MEIRNKKMCFLGDSITEGAGASSIEKVYWKRFEQDGATVKGYGIGGTRIARQQVPSSMEIYDKYFRTRVEEMDKDADIVVVFGGTNDYGHGDAAMGKMTDRTDDTFYGALHNLYTELISKYPSAQIVVITPCHRVGENKLYNESGVRNVGTLEDYVNVIIEVAGYYGIPVFDLYRQSGINPEIEIKRGLYMQDGLHPTDAGYEIIYNKLKKFIESL